MPTKNNNKRIDQRAADQALIDGLTKHAGVLATLVIGGAPHTPTELVTVLQGRIAARASAAAARAPWLAAVQAERDESDKTQSLVSGLRQAIRTAFASQVDLLADFGLKPRKAAAPRTPEEKAASVAKARATREARHTMGSKQRKRITGTAPVAAPVAAPAAAPSTAPATPAASAQATAPDVAPPTTAPKS
jgi:hypothetical protein